MGIILCISLLLGMVGGIEDALAVFKKLESTTVTVQYENARVREVIADLALQLPVAVRGDWPALKQIGVDPDDRITLTLDQMDGWSALSGIALFLGDEYERPVFEVHAGQVVLTSTQATSAMRLLNVYDVRDLLAAEELLEQLREDRPAIHATPEEETPEVEENEPEDEIKNPRMLRFNTLDLPEMDDEESYYSKGEELIQLLIAHVDPEAWIDYGGDVAKIDERDGILMVSAAPSIHRRLLDALERLRRANSSMIRIEAIIIDLSVRQFQLLQQRHRPGSGQLHTALLRAAEDRTLWRSSSSVGVDRVLILEAQAGSSACMIEFSTQRERETGMLTLDLSAVMEAEGDRRVVKTSLTYPASTGYAAIEFPTSSPGKSGDSSQVRILLLKIRPE